MTPIPSKVGQSPNLIIVKSKTEAMWIEEVPNKEQGVLIDVRSKEEFELMHVENSVNIPWDMHLYYLDDLAKLPKPWMFCCEAGYRSGLVVFSLRNLGYRDVYNVGRWFDIKTKQTQEVETNI